MKIYRKFGLNLSNLIFMQIESPLRKNDFFIKKVCLGSKNKKKKFGKVVLLNLTFGEKIISL